MFLAPKKGPFRPVQIFMQLVIFKPWLVLILCRSYAGPQSPILAQGQGAPMNLQFKIDLEISLWCIKGGVLSITYKSLYCLNWYRYLWWSHSSFVNRKKVKCSDSMMFELGSMNLGIRFLDSFFRFESFVGHGLWMKPKKWKSFFCENNVLRIQNRPRKIPRKFLLAFSKIKNKLNPGQFWVHLTLW